MSMIDAEYHHCRAAGLPAERVGEIPLPFGVAAAVTVPDQVQVDPMPILFTQSTGRVRAAPKCSSGGA